MNTSRAVRLAIVAAALALAANARAHITLAEPSARAASYHAAFFRVSHGCAGSPTITLRILIPAAIMVARPQPKPGWTLSMEKAPSAGSSRVFAITWTGRLDTEQFDQFGVMLKLPAAPGKLYFPTVQTCEVGHSDWTMIPTAGQSSHALASPAPMLEVTPAIDDPMEHMKM